jgi:subtilisin
MLYYSESDYWVALYRSMTEGKSRGWRSVARPITEGAQHAKERRVSSPYQRRKKMMQKSRRWGMVLLALIMAYVLLLTAAPASQGQSFDNSDTQSPAGTSVNSEQSETADSSHLLRKAEREGSIRTIVGLRTDFVPEGRLNRAEAADQRRGIESAGRGLQAELAGSGFRTLREYDTVPYIALNLTPQAFRAVQNSPRVTTIQEDVAVPATLEESAPVVQAPTMWTNSLMGTGKSIAILDTGVDANHSFFGNRVVEEACFTSDGGAPLSNRTVGSGNCPNGTNTQTGTGAGVPCTYAASGCQHGTHVAGIAAGNGSTFSGVAPRANIVSIQVFSRATGKACTDAGQTEDPCALSFTSDQIAALEHVLDLSERDDLTFSAVNMSLGGGNFTSACDTTFPAYKAAIDNLSSISAATVIASGNSGFTNAVGAPACISSAITVGSTTKPTVSAADSIASSSNMSSLVDLLAPGVNINSSIPGGGFGTMSGTSMAAPHVAGAWALLEQDDAGNTVQSIEQLLQMTGTPVTDNRTGGTVTKRRINIADAAKERPPNDFFSFPRDISGTAVSLSGANGGINGAATRESGEPDHLPANAASLGENSVWYKWTAPISGTVFINTCTSSFDTVLAAYTGGATFTSLTQVASDDDACDAANGSGSRISFNAVAGTEYRIAVAGYRADTRGEGTFTFNLSVQPSPKADYRFQDTKSTSVGSAPTLTDIGPGTNTFTTTTIDGTSRKVLSFPQGNGVKLSPTTGVIPNGTYTIVALFKLDSVSGYRRIIDFKNGTTDNGLYVHNGNLEFFQERALSGSPAGTGAPIGANRYVQVVLTRDSNRVVTGYVDGVEQFSFSDTFALSDSINDAVIDTNNTLRFFRDNESGGVTTEHSAGSVGRIRLYDGALKPSEVGALDRIVPVIDQTPPKVTSATPANNATGVAPGANVKAIFSEPMQGSSVNTATFKLKKAGTTNFLTATVTYDPVTKKATLNPNNNLQSGVTYVATVTSGAQDEAGNSLDQNASLAGDQPKSWKFTVG